MEVDPDYTGFVVDPQEELQEEQSKILQENARGAAVDKIKSIISEQFDKEIQIKENELTRINQKLADARCVMDRLRACAVASFYATSFTKPVDGAKGPESGAAYHPAIQNVMRKAVTSVLSKNAPYRPQPLRNDLNATQEAVNNEETGNDISFNESVVDQPEEKEKSVLVHAPKNQEEESAAKVAKTEKTEKAPRNLGGRQRIKKTIVVGNVSKYIPSDQREASDKSTHKWMVYVRGSKEEPRIDHFVRKVWFFLHPSYRPNDLVEVCEAPFHLTRRGWGEFPIRVQIHFCDRRNRPVDIIHGLRLDRTYTGLQTLGAETVCDVELDRSSVQLTVDDILEVSNLPNLAPDDTSDKQEREENSHQDEKKEEEKADDKEAEPKMDSETTETDPAANETSNEEMTTVVPELKYSEKHQFQPVTTSCTISSDTVSPQRKRKLDEGEEMSSSPAEKKEDTSEDVAGEKVQMAGDEAESTEDPVPRKRRRKRRRDSQRISASEDEIFSDSSTSKSAEEGDIDTKEMPIAEEAVESVTISQTLTSSNKEETEEDLDVETTDGSSLMKISKNDEKESPSSSKQDQINESQSSSGSSDLSLNLKQPVVVLPRSPVTGTSIFRMRSASDGDGFPCSNLIKSAVTVSPVINVKLNPDSTNTATSDVGQSAPVKKVTVVSPRGEILPSKGASLPTVVKSSEMDSGVQKHISVKKQPVESSAMHISIPFSSLLKSGTTTSQPHVLKLPLSSSSTTGQTFSVNMLNLASQGVSAKPREKRSFSADQVPFGTQQPIHLHIISPQKAKLSTPPKRSIATSQASVTLQALSGNLSLAQAQQARPEDSHKSSKQDANIGQQQYVLATVVNPKGKQQLALINPSTLSLGTSKKLITIVSSKGRKQSLSTSKQAPIQRAVAGKAAKSNEGRRPSQQENIIPQTKPEPIHKVVGDQILLQSSMKSLEEDILPHVVERIPLINEKRDLTQFPFCAKTEADFLNWNVGKQRASEWQRASLVQKVLQYIQGKSEIHQKCQLPSKKFIMNWCLRHGYSVFTDEYVDEPETNEEEKKKKEEELNDLPLTMTSANEIVKLLDAKKEELSKEDKSLKEEDDDVIFVDVVTVDSPAPKMMDVKQEPLESVDQVREKSAFNDEIANKIQALIESPEVAAVDEMTRKIDVNLHRTYGMPASHIVIAKALQQFTESILRKSLSCVLRRRDGSSLQRVVPEEIQVTDVVSAIREMSALDFLTNRHTASQS